MHIPVNSTLTNFFYQSQKIYHIPIYLIAEHMIDSVKPTLDLKTEHFKMQ